MFIDGFGKILGIWHMVLLFNLRNLSDDFAKLWFYPTDSNSQNKMLRRLELLIKHKNIAFKQMLV